MANTTITVAPNLVQEAWAKATWSAGIHKSFFDKFTGTDAGSIIQVKEELKKDKGDSINIPLLMPLTGAGITGDNMLEGNEEALIYRDFSVSIDQLRNAVRLQGKMDEQKTQINMRQDAKTALSDWLATKVDKMIFTALTTDPTANRVVYGGAATSEAAIAAGDKFTVDLIGKAKRMAMEDENTMVKPVRIDGVDTYVMVIDQWQARDLMADTKWIEAQEHANIRGEKNPIFLGAQAAVMAVGAEPEWKEDTFDYKNQVGFEFGRIFGIAKSQFKYDGTNLTDFGCINVLTSSVDD